MARLKKISIEEQTKNESKVIDSKSHCVKCGKKFGTYIEYMGKRYCDLACQNS